MLNSKTLIPYGPTKIKDALFLGDESIAHDLQWLSMNKITHIINCVGKQVKNLFQAQGLQYLTFPWVETQTQILFDSKDYNIKEIVSFIEEAYADGGGVLVHSKKSDSRSCCVLSAYFMKRFKWNLLKTLQFLNSRKEDIELQPHFFEQLNSLQLRLAKAGLIKAEYWENDNIQPEQLILRNTYLNSKEKPSEDPYFLRRNQINKKGGEQPIKWKDTHEHQSKLIMEHKFNQNDSVSSNPVIQVKKLRLKSILKGSNRVIQLKQKVVPSKEQQRNRSSKSILDKESKKRPLETPMSSTFLDNKTNMRPASKEGANKQLMKEQANNKENVKMIPRNRVSSYEKFKKTALQPRQISNTEVNKKILQIQQDNINNTLNIAKEPQKQQLNNWVIKTDLKGLKGMEEQILKKQSKPVIIVKPNLNVTILSNPFEQQLKRPASEKKTSTKTTPSNQDNSDLYSRVLKQRQIAESNMDFNRKERSNSAKAKVEDSFKARERELYNINSLLEMQSILKPKWRK